MIRFIHYYGHEIHIDPARILMVEDGGCGSRGLSVTIHLDTGKTVSVSGRVDEVRQSVARHTDRAQAAESNLAVAVEALEKVQKRIKHGVSWHLAEDVLRVARQALDRLKQKGGK